MDLVFIFFMVPILAALVTGGVLAIGAYNADPEGWKATFKRLSRVSRANLEAAKDVPVLEPAKKLEDKAVKEWEAEFSGKPLALPETQLKHVIVKTDYYKAHTGGYWPQWHCKCGASDKHPVISDGLHAAERRALKAGANHVKSMNEVEEKLHKSGGKFAF